MIPKTRNGFHSPNFDSASLFQQQCIGLGNVPPSTLIGKYSSKASSTSLWISAVTVAMERVKCDLMTEIWYLGVATTKGWKVYFWWKACLLWEKIHRERKPLTHSLECNPGREHMLRYPSIFGNELRVIYHNPPVQKSGNLENSIGILIRVEASALTWKG